eukprot:3374107-Lingulodinium_polyedra.AAC.1
MACPFESIAARSRVCHCTCADVREDLASASTRPASGTCHGCCHHVRLGELGLPTRTIGDNLVAAVGAAAAAWCVGAMALLASLTICENVVAAVGVAAAALSSGAMALLASLTIVRMWWLPSRTIGDIGVLPWELQQEH